MGRASMSLLGVFSSLMCVGACGRGGSSSEPVWLGDVFATPTPLPAPKLPRRITGGVGSDTDDSRRAYDVQTINRALGRTAVTRPA